MSNRLINHQPQIFCQDKGVESKHETETWGVLPTVSLPTRQEMSAKTLSILLVDDEPGIRQLLKQGLSVQGYQLYEASDGLTGLEQFHTIHPDLVLLDIMMPGMDGFATLREIRRQDTVVGVIMVSALNPERIAIEAMVTGADGYLAKPFKLQAIFAEIERVGNVVRLRQHSRAYQRKRIY